MFNEPGARAINSNSCLVPRHSIKTVAAVLQSYRLEPGVPSDDISGCFYGVLVDVVPLVVSVG